VTLLASAQPFSQKAVEIQAQPGKPPIRVRANVITRSASQGFKTTGSIRVLLAAATGTVVYTNQRQSCPGGCDSPGYIVPKGQRLLDSADGIWFAQTSGNTLVPWGGVASVSITAVERGSAGNVGSNVIDTMQPSNGDIRVTNPQATGHGANASFTPQMTVGDFDAARAVLEQELRQSIGQLLVANRKPGETLSETVIYSAPLLTTDHQPGDKVPAFNATMSLQGEGDFYVEGDVKKAFETYLAQRVPNNQQLITDGPVQVDYRLLSSNKGGQLVFVGDAAAFVAPKLDMDKIRAQIVGRPLAQARFYLQGLNVRSVSIKEQPLALPLMPLIGNRIAIHYVVEQSAAPALAPTG
jgi:hypothetical protein